MTVVGNIFQYVFPGLVVCLAVVLLCFYVHTKKKRALYEITSPRQGGNVSSAVQTISLSEDQVEVEILYDRIPPRYSTVDHPPPYSLFDPKQTGAWPGGPPPAYEMYPITLPLASHHWMSPPVNHNHPNPPTSHREPSGLTPP